jgi:hypothetical protein
MPPKTNRHYLNSKFVTEENTCVNRDKAKRMIDSSYGKFKRDWNKKPDSVNVKL